jgi:hypothetical protein
VTSCGMAVYSGTIGMVRSAGVPSGGGVVAMGVFRVTTLHPQEMGKLELPLLLEVESSSLVDSM